MRPLALRVARCRSRLCTSTPAGGTASFDRVRRLEGARIASAETPDGYVLEAAVPLEELGLKVESGLRLKMDWGVLSAGPEGNSVARRLYWAEQSAIVTSDEPSEARLHPALWGTVRFSQRSSDPRMLKPTELKDLTGEKGLDDDDVMKELQGE